MADPPPITFPAPADGSGRYRYLLNGQLAEVTETFEVSGAGCSIQSRRTAPGGTELVVQAERSGPHDARCTLSFASDAVAPVQVEYLLVNGVLQMQRNQGDKTVHRGPAVLSPLMRVFQGPAIASVLSAGGKHQVIVPALDPGDRSGLLLAIVEPRRAEVLEAARPGDAGVTRRCRYVGGNYDDEAEFWLDDRDRLARYRFPQGPDHLWEVVLDLMP